MASGEKMSAEDLFIGQLSSRSGLSRDTLRFYEKEGLLKAKRLDNNYRVYQSSDVDRLKFVASARAAGFSLREILDILKLAVKSRKCADYERVARRKLDEIDARIDALRRCRLVLEQTLACCNSADDPCKNMPAVGSD
jgi:DNA-binding transcriptional MerR regulator